MARFLAADAFHAPEKAVTLLPFRFQRTDPAGISFQTWSAIFYG